MSVSRSPVILTLLESLGPTHLLVASCLSTSRCTEASQDNECVARGALVDYDVEHGIEHLFLLKFTRFGRGLHCNKIYIMKPEVYL